MASAFNLAMAEQLAAMNDEDNYEVARIGHRQAEARMRSIHVSGAEQQRLRCR